jgi:hypothetical protein
METVDKMEKLLHERIIQIYHVHGRDAAISKDELLGTLLVEVFDLIRAVKTNNLDDITNGTLDLAAAAIHGISSIKQGCLR